eukprot:4824221-Pyramimonas_sp.AAC.1
MAARNVARYSHGRTSDAFFGGRSPCRKRSTSLIATRRGQREPCAPRVSGLRELGLRESPSVTLGHPWRTGTET